MADFKSSLPIRTESTDDVQVSIYDSTGTNAAGVDANNDLCVKSKTLDGDGNPVNNANPLPVTSSLGACDEDYNTAAAVAAAASSDHDYLKGAAGQFVGAVLSASGCARWEIQIGPVASETTRFVVFTTAAEPTKTINLPCGIAIGAADNIKITRTNTDEQAMDVYSTILTV